MAYHALFTHLLIFILVDERWPPLLLINFNVAYLYQLSSSHCFSCQNHYIHFYMTSKAQTQNIGIHEIPIITTSTLIYEVDYDSCGTFISFYFPFCVL